MRGCTAIEIASGLLPGAEYIPSPNHDWRPTGCQPDLIVIHSISLPAATYGGSDVIRLFLNQLTADDHPSYTTIASLRVSAHLFIRRDGHVMQFVPFDRRAWHAGRSQYQGRNECNDFSIGIELEGTDRDAFTDAQYRALTHIIPTLCRAYPGLSYEHLVGHSDISPERKTDPGQGFDWRRLRLLLADRATT